MDEYIIERLDTLKNLIDDYQKNLVRYNNINIINSADSCSNNELNNLLKSIRDSFSDYESFLSIMNSNIKLYNLTFNNVENLDSVDCNDSNDTIQITISNAKIDSNTTQINELFDDVIRNNQLEKIFQSGVITTQFDDSNERYNYLLKNKFINVQKQFLCYDELKKYIKGDQDDKKNIIDAIYYYNAKKRHPDLDENNLQNIVANMKISDASNHYEMLHHSPIVMEGEIKIDIFKYNDYYVNIYDPDMPTMKVALRTLKNETEFVELRYDPVDVINLSSDYYHDISLLQNNYTDNFKEVANNYVDNIFMVDFNYETGAEKSNYNAYCRYKQERSDITVYYERVNNNYSWIVRHTYNHELGHAFDNSKKIDEDYFQRITGEDSVWCNNVYNELMKKKSFYVNILREYSFKNPQELFADMTSYYYDPTRCDKLKQIEINVEGYDNAYDYMEYLLNN